MSDRAIETLLGEERRFPPRNHFANGSSHSESVSKGANQLTRSRASRSQKASGSTS